MWPMNAPDRTQIPQRRCRALKQKPGPSVTDEFSVADFKLEKNGKQHHDGIASKLVDTFHKIEPNMYPSLAAQLARKLPEFMEITKENQLSSPKQHPLYNLMRGTGDSKEKRVTYPSWFFLATEPTTPSYSQSERIYRSFGCFNGRKSAAEAEPVAPLKIKSKSKSRSKAKSKSSALATKNTLPIETELQPIEANFVPMFASVTVLRVPPQADDQTIRYQKWLHDCSGTARMSAAEPIEQIRVAQIAIDERHESKPDPETTNNTDEHKVVEHEESWDKSDEFEGFPHEEEPDTTMTPEAAPDAEMTDHMSPIVKDEEESNTPDAAPYPYPTEI
ncbi:hypothetical protein FALBO_6874 [Fusarium albosuccineum]|uniref:Uncharacterized protein n=1 Tax=Fusarium albosuccineum TaxID=1237068 RepID=A0A8H4PCZ2_9HYPO|nr:hypothetical protein FALBO_6874 [Fusarium albosuccineum]